MPRKFIYYKFTSPVALTQETVERAHCAMCDCVSYNAHMTAKSHPGDQCNQLLIACEGDVCYTSNPARITSIYYVDCIHTDCYALCSNSILRTPDSVPISHLFLYLIPSHFPHTLYFATPYPVLHLHFALCTCLTP